MDGRAYSVFFCCSVQFHTGIVLALNWKDHLRAKASRSLEVMQPAVLGVKRLSTVCGVLVRIPISASIHVKDTCLIFHPELKPVKGCEKGTSFTVKNRKYLGKITRLLYTLILCNRHA